MTALLLAFFLAHATGTLAPAAWTVDRAPVGVALADSAQSSERIVEVRIQGNYRTAEDEIRRIAAVQIGDIVGTDTIDLVQQRLEKSGKFDEVEVRKRWRTIDSTEDIVLLVIVREVPGGSSNPLGRVVRSLARPLVLPVVNYADGYGFTYGARLSPLGLLGENTYVSIPLTWGATKQAAFELDRPLARGPLTRVTSNATVRERENPFFKQDDLRRTVGIRGERAVGSFVRAGLSGSLGTVSFGPAHQRLSTYGVDLALDTRQSPDLPRNATYVQAGWDRLKTGGASIDRYRTDARAYVGLPGSSIVAVRAVRAVAESALPPFEQLLLGGASSVRGFRTGHEAGDRMALGSVEWRVPLTSPVSFGRAGASIFADTGAVYATGTRLRDARFRTGIGAGLFFNAAIFNLNVDVARGLDEGFRLHISSGFQF